VFLFVKSRVIKGKLAMQYSISVATAIASFMSVSAFAGAHIEAKNCEIFVDRIGLTTHSHGSVAAHFFIKTINSHLDGSVIEVGARSQEYVQETNGRAELSSFNDLKADPFFGADDYFEVTQSLGNDYSSSRFQTAFYVRTSNNTTYWLKPHNAHKYNNGGNFGYDRALFSAVSDLLRPFSIYHGAFTDSVETRGNEMGAFNEGNCR
jgi:hypothetical protein